MTQRQIRLLEIMRKYRNIGNYDYYLASKYIEKLDKELKKLYANV